MNNNNCVWTTINCRILRVFLFDFVFPSFSLCFPFHSPPDPLMLPLPPHPKASSLCPGTRETFPRYAIPYTDYCEMPSPASLCTGCLPERVRCGRLRLGNSGIRGEGEEDCLVGTHRLLPRREKFVYKIERISVMEGINIKRLNRTVHYIVRRRI